MRTVWKFNLEEGINKLELPLGYEVLSVKEQLNSIVLYCLVEVSVVKIAKVEARFEVVGTGFMVRSSKYNSDFLGTVLTDGGHSAYHIFHSVRKAV